MVCQSHIFRNVGLTYHKINPAFSEMWDWHTIKSIPHFQKCGIDFMVCQSHIPENAGLILCYVNPVWDWKFPLDDFTSKFSFAIWECKIFMLLKTSTPFLKSITGEEKIEPCTDFFCGIWILKKSINFYFRNI